MFPIAERMRSTLDFLREFCYPSDRSKIRRDPYWSARVQEEYNRMQNGMPKIDAISVEGHIEPIIEDSEEFVLIDIGSGFGKRFPLPLAKRTPKARIYIVDKLEADTIDEFLKLEKQINPDYKLFEMHTKPDKPENWMNSLLANNGYRNVVYIQKDMNPREPANLPELRYTTRGRRVFITGLKNPRLLSIATANEAIYQAAESCFITPSALELLTAEEAMMFFRGFTEEFAGENEIKKLFEMVHDENLRANVDEYGKTGFYPVSGTKTEKFDYNNDLERMIGISLKQIFALAIASKISPAFDLDVKLVNQNGFLSYNQPDHLIVARRGQPVKTSPHLRQEEFWWMSEGERRAWGIDHY